MAGLTIARVAKRNRPCHSRFYESGCTGLIRAGELYARTAYPPESDPLYQPRWAVFAECARCAAWCGRDLDKPTHPAFAMEINPDTMEVIQ